MPADLAVLTEVITEVICQNLIAIDEYVPLDPPQIGGQSGECCWVLFGAVAVASASCCT